MGSSFGKALSSAGSSIGRAVGGGGGNLLSEVVVQGARPALASSLGSAVGRGLGAGAGSVLGSALAGSGGGGNANVQPQAPANSNEIAGIDVVGTRAPSSLANMNFGGSLMPALGAGMAAMAAPAAAPAPAPALANMGGANEVEGIDVLGIPPSSTGIDSGAIAGAAGVNTLGGDINSDTLQDLPGEEIADEPGEEGIGKEAGLLGLLGALGLRPQDLLGMGLMGAGLLAGNKQGDTSQQTDQLQGLADSNKNLANTLSQTAMAGLEGNIGAKGMGALRRMVRNAQAAIRQRYAGMGMSGSSAEAADLNAAAQAGVDMQFDMGQKIAQVGLQQVAALTGQSAAAYTQLLNAQTQKNTALGNALANFTGAAAKTFFKDAA